MSLTDRTARLLAQEHFDRAASAIREGREREALAEARLAIQVIAHEDE